jgi:DNA (cytosine-5)-methyltransferase 1
MKNLNFIDLFAGASGMSEGFIKAGFNPISHVEMDKEACFTIKTRAAFHYLTKTGKSKVYFDYLLGKINRDQLYGEVPSEIIDSVLNVEITDTSMKSIIRQIRILQKDKAIELVIGGPPCQAYSVVGRSRDSNNMENDPRNILYVQYGKFLEVFKPRAFVFENVPGLLSAGKGEHFKNLKDYFRTIGYEVYHKVLDASDYGVLQARKRVIIVGWLKANDFGFPKLDDLPKKYRVDDAFFDLPRLKSGEGNRVANYRSEKNEYLEKFDLRNCVDFVTQHISRPHNERDLAIYQFAIDQWNTRKVRIKYTDLPNGLKTHKNITSFLDRFKVVNGDGYSHTIVAHISKDGHYYIHPDIDQCRSISIREAARLQSFPDDFYFEGSRSAAFRQIGNAVPPLMSYAIAQKMMESLWQ